jgi:mannose-6-phosphate isomerase-like protein (cupin superfamily)
MPVVSRQSATRTETAPGYEGHFEDAGEYTIAFETYTEDADLSPYFEGLPNNQCQCPHWGYVVKGKVAFHYGDHSEIVESGHAYFIPPGHTPQLFAGTEVVEFSPTTQLQETIDVVMKNLENAQ